MNENNEQPCVDCGEPVVYDETTGDYLHVNAESGCFLNGVPVPPAAITMEIIDGPVLTADDEGWRHYHYTLRLSFDGRSMQTDWRQGTGLLDPPQLADVLGAMLSDASGVEQGYGNGFEDWANEYGYDPDSRKAERIYEACVAQTAMLRELLGSEFESAVWPDIDNEEAVARLIETGAVHAEVAEAE